VPPPGVQTPGRATTRSLLTGCAHGRKTVDSASERDCPANRCATLAPSLPTLSTGGRKSMMSRVLGRVYSLPSTPGNGERRSGPGANQPRWTWWVGRFAPHEGGPDWAGHSAILVRAEPSARRQQPPQQALVAIAKIANGSGSHVLHYWSTTNAFATCPGERWQIAR